MYSTVQASSASRRTTTILLTHECLVLLITSYIHRNIKDLMNHVIEEGNRIWEGTRRAETWMIYHDHLKIWWEKESQEYLKTLPCPIEGNPNRTWYDRQIKICGENNQKVERRYKNCLPGDSPELMPLDCHLFADLQEGAAKNVALTFHILDGDEDAHLKYSFATPAKVFEALQRTIAAGCPSPKRISEDIGRIFTETLGRIIAAEGCYIEDSSKKIMRHGVRAEAAAEHKRESVPVDPSVVAGFQKMVKKMKNGEGLSFLFDESEDVLVNDTLTTLPLTDDPDDDDNEEDVDC
jgi:hypothetical protein